MSRGRERGRRVSIGCTRAAGWGLCLLLALVLVQAAQAEPLVVRYPDTGSERDTRNDYYLKLLRLALEKSRPDYGDYRLEAKPMRIPQGRILRMISANDEVDVFWSMTTEERESFLRPVRFPLLKGLNGYRLLIVRSEDLAEFETITDPGQLAGKVAGQQADWPDTDILRANDLPVTTGSYDLLFTMLNHHRFDYIPRAVNEPWSELEQRPELNLAVEPGLMLYYPTAHYFFTHRDHRVLAERLMSGLSRAMEDGSFDQLFYHHPANREAFARAGLEGRRTLELSNPLLPEATPLERARLWWSPAVDDIDTLTPELSLSGSKRSRP